MGREAEEQKTLNKLELAAEETGAPEEIERQAEKDESKQQSARARFWFVPYLIAAALIGGIIFLGEWKPGLIGAAWGAKIRRYSFGGLVIVFVLAAMRALEIYILERLRNPVARFNLKRIVHLLVGLGLVFISISVLFENWYAAVVSLGLISLILGFALQTPISSFIGWVYILARRPYRVGDRIEIGEARGDVIDVSYLDTTLWEIGGRHLSTDHPSGRLIKFPNTQVLSQPVYNYSWPLFPYIWNEVKFHIAYESDLEFVGATMQRIAEEELGTLMQEQVKIFRRLLAQTPVDHLEVREKPAVLFRVSENTWLEAIVRYLVFPKEAGRVKTQLTRKLLTALNEQPDKVLFPKGNAR
jgi:small-conductance mechanosensitive channel